jgi:PhnB protein
MHTTETSRIPRVPNPPPGLPRVLPHLIYDDVAAAVEWLTRAFGFRERTAFRHASADGRVGRTQIQVADSVITVGEPSVHGNSPHNGASSMLYVYVDNVDEHHRRARAAGAHIILELEERPWGDRVYQAVDPEGHQWSFAQHVRDVELTDEHLTDGA